MTQEGIRAVWGWLLDGAGMAVWGLCFVALLGLIARPYLSKYLEEKGKNLATKEDFSKLREQLQQTTRDSEEIKQLLVGRGWLAQQRWARKEKHVVELVVALEKVYRFGKVLQKCKEKNAKGTLKEEIKSDGSIIKELERLDESRDQLMASVAVARIYLSDSILRPITSLIDEYRDGKAVDLYSDSFAYFDYYSAWSNSAKSVLDAVISEAQQELAKLAELSTPA